MFQEIDYLFHFSEKPADVSREISCFVSEQKLKFQKPSPSLHPGFCVRFGFSERSLIGIGYR